MTILSTFPLTRSKFQFDKVNTSSSGKFFSYSHAHQFPYNSTVHCASGLSFPLPPFRGLSRSFIASCVLTTTIMPGSSQSSVSSVSSRTEVQEHHTEPGPQPVSSKEQEHQEQCTYGEGESAIPENKEVRSTVGRLVGHPFPLTRPFSFT